MSAGFKKDSTLQSECPKSNITVCHYFKLGKCRYGYNCRYSHSVENDDGAENRNCKLSLKKTPSDWINAPIFVPKYKTILHDKNTNTLSDVDSYSNYTNGYGTNPSSTELNTYVFDVICPFEGPCPNGSHCEYAIHLELCEMCNQYCLHPTDMEQRRAHNKECIQHHEQAMELSFAIARSENKTCGICFETVMDKLSENRFGILPNCCHVFCLECIRKWRQAKQFKRLITRSCPECRIPSDFVCPSSYWVDSKEDKEKLLKNYRAALGDKDCKYFKKGEGKCPFGNKCFYKHALPNGGIVDLGYPNSGRKIFRSPNEIMELLDVYLWDFFDYRDNPSFEVITVDDNLSDSSDE